MADPLSVVASSFAVVGVADIVLRTCLKCRQFLSDIEDAPTSIETLETCLRSNISLVQTLRNHVNYYTTSQKIECRSQVYIYPAPTLLPGGWYGFRTATSTYRSWFSSEQTLTRDQETICYRTYKSRNRDKPEVQ
jgi:hypothetical protein